LIEGGNLSQRMSDFTLAEVDQRTLAESADRGSGKEESAARQMVMARLLVSVARAVHYAHQRGILHRDLKPSNILLGRDNAPFVSDFGLAKRVDAMNSDEQEQLTRTGVIVGTPSYMSPEQARGVKALTTAADVYALGAILYHLITGEAPFRAPTALDIIHKVITEEVRPPRQLQPRVAVDLETICLKCLRKDPPARYSSAEELARDLERFERGEPILARPVSAWEKSWRWMRRNRAVASLILAIAGLLLVAVVFSTALAVWALAEKSRADDTAMDERAARGLAESNLTLAERAVEDFLDKIEEHPRLREADFLDLRRELLASALPFYEEIVQQKPGDANLELKRGRAYARLGFLHSALGKKQNAVEDYRKSQALIRSQAEAAPAELEHRHQLARSHNELGAILRDLSRREEAEREFLQALKLSTALVEADGTNPKHRLELSHANGNLAVLLRDWGKPAEAEPLRRRSLEMLEKLAADHPGYSQYTLGLVMACNNLGGLLRDLGRLEDAVQEFQRAQKTCEPVLATTPDSVGFRHELARSYRFQGVVLSDLHRREEAERAYRQSIPHYKRLADNFPSSPHYRHELSMSHNSLGLLLQGLQRPQEAETQYRAAIAFQQLLVDSFPDSPAYRQSLARSRHNLGNVLVERGQRAEGEKEIRLALGLHKQLMEQESALPEHKSSYASTLHDLARCFKEREEFGEARRLFEQAVQFQRQAYHTAPKHPIYGRFLVKHTWELAHVKLELGAHQQTADTAAELILIRPEDGGDAASAAELTAWCITAVGKDRQLTAEAQRERAADYAARSMALLTDAVRRGYTNVESLNRSKAFAPMRDRPDFKKLLEDLEARRKTAPR